MCMTGFVEDVRITVFLSGGGIVNDEGTLAVPAVRHVVDLGHSPWSDHSPASMPEVWEASPNAACPSLVGPGPSSTLETYCTAKSRAPLRAKT